MLIVLGNSNICNYK